MIMERNLEQRRQYDEPFKQAAAHFFHHSGRSLEEVSTELGLSPADLRTWKRKYPVTPPQKTAARPLSHVSQLRAENQALRDEILHLKVQWDVLKTTLGILSAGRSSEQKNPLDDVMRKTPRNLSLAPPPVPFPPFDFAPPPPPRFTVLLKQQRVLAGEPRKIPIEHLPSPRRPILLKIVPWKPIPPTPRA